MQNQIINNQKVIILCNRFKKVVKFQTNPIKVENFKFYEPGVKNPISFASYIE